MDKKETPDEIIEKVYERFIEADGSQVKWSNLDTNMANLEWIEDHQLIKDAEMTYVKLEKKGTPRCRYDHSDSACFVPTIMLSVLYILEKYDNDAKLDMKTQYILRYFLSLESIGEIFSS